jgi:hypothetical protein
MSAIADIKLLTTIVDKILSYSDKHKVRVNNAITAIDLAWSRTYHYLKIENGIYEYNEELSDLWRDAATSTRLINPNLARQLHNKSRFWIYPDLPRQGNILKLTEVNDAIERLKKRFE